MGGGRISVYGDSNCLDSSHMVTNCYWLLRKILDFTSGNIKDPVLFSESVRKHEPLYRDDSQLPTRRTDVNFSTYSAVSGKDLICRCDSRFDIWGTKGYSSQVMGKNRRLPGFPPVDFGTDLNLTMENSTFKTIKEGSSVSRTGNKYSKSMDFLGLLNRDELELPGFVESQWLIPFLVAFSGLLLLLSFWRIRQKRRRRKRGSGSGRVFLGP